MSILEKEINIILESDIIVLVVNMKKIKLFWVFLVSFIYMEIIYKIFVVHHFGISLLNMFLYIIFLSFCLNLICNLFKNPKVNKIISFCILGIISIWFSASYVLKSYFDITLSLEAFFLADQVADFAFKGLIEVLRRLPIIILYLIPFILSLIFQKHIHFEQNKKQNIIIMIIGLLLSYLLYIGSLRIDKENNYSSYYLYYKINDTTLNVDNFGVLNAFFINLKRNIFGFKEELILDTNIDINSNEEGNDNNTPEVINYDYNNLDFDFNSLKETETNNNVKLIHEYMASNSGTLQNEYTGIFKDKNLILFMAESFNEIAVREDLTPTLYKLVNSGFIFDNFYTPTIYSTIGGEFQELSGLYAQSTSILSKFRSGNIAFPQGISNKFKEMGYQTYAYHNNTYTFQDRNKYLKSMGFDNFKACGNGLEKEINCNIWPRSDVELIEKTIDEYTMNDDKFMVFYATNSGHSPYDSLTANAMARKHKEEYEAFNLPYSKRAASYLASQMELDRALETLINKLAEKGILEDTVIALVGDHYPYELNMNEINEFSTFKREEKVTVNKSSFIFWNSAMEPVHISKVGSQLDVMPTIYNAFGVNYDSRLFIGNDILSTSDGLAIFADRSWVSDKGVYYYSKREFIPNEGIEYDDNYIKYMNNMVNNKITISKMIIENDYYRKLFK